MTEHHAITPREAAHRLGICLDSVYSLVWAGKLPAKRVDGRWQISAQAVDERLRAQAVQRRKERVVLNRTRGEVKP
jgi:excisionase family DNA binding protein